MNALLTALIVYKIITVFNEIRGFNNSNIRTSARRNGRPDLNPLISILIESGLMTFVGQLAQCLMFRLSSDESFPLISGVVVMLYVRALCPLLIWCFNLLLITQGISMVVVLVRVETGVSYEQNTLRTVNSTNLGTSESIHRAPLALKFTKFGQTDSSNDAYSGSSYAQIDTADGSDAVVQNLNYS